ncbi:MAG: amidohydrolase family protein [Clostridiales bacterium]|nr:amidohydrolase family protein [Clostridiales bacterium]
MKSYCSKFNKRTPALLLAFVMLVTTFSLGASAAFANNAEDPVSAERAVWGGDFDPAAALAKQGPYDPGKYYVWYNGNFFTEADPADFDYGAADRKPGKIISANKKINSYLGAYAIVTKGQYIELVAKGAGDLASLATEIGTAAAPGANAEWVDLKGATVVPGLNEAHMHFTSTGTLANQIDIFWKSKAGILAAVEAEARRLQALGIPTTQWIVSRGWLQTLGGDWNVPHPDSVMNWPTRWELDTVTKDLGPEFNYPVRLGHASGHGAWYNTAAMESSRWAYDPEHPPTTPIVGGEIIINDKGQAIGILTDTAAFSAPGSTAAETRAGIFAAEDQCFSYGLTSVMDAGSSISTFRMYEDAYKGQLQDFTGRFLKIRMDMELSDGTNAIRDFKNEVAGRERADEYGRLIGDFGERLTVRAIKWFMDGALGVRTAGMIDPYTDDPDGVGDIGMRRTYAASKTIQERTVRNGWQSSAHAIGDLANRHFIDTYLETKDQILKDATAVEAEDPAEAARLRALVADDRHRPEHYQIVSILEKDKIGGKNDIERAIEAGMVLSMQFKHGTTDMAAAEDRIGPDRIRGAYAWRSIIDLGGIIANGTDSSVELLNPFHNLYAAVTRVSLFGTIGRQSPAGKAIDVEKFKLEYEPGTRNFTEDSGWYADQRLTRAEALHYSTWGGAYASFEEKLKGTLRPGYLADFVVLDRAYFDRSACYDVEIKELNSVMTVLGGEIVYTMDTPVITTAGTVPAEVGEAYSSAQTAKGTENFVWSIVSADPELDWLNIDEYKGTLSGIPTCTGTYKVTVQAENYLGSDTKELTIEIGAVVKVKLGVAEVSGIEGDVEYTLSIGGAQDVLDIEFVFEVDSSMLSWKGLDTLNGFTTVDGIAWRSMGGDIWRGTATIAYPAGDSVGFTTVGDTVIAKLVFAPRALGDAAVKLLGFKAVGYVDGVTQYLDSIIVTGEATTFIDKLIYSKYDLNKDGVVDALDLGIMLLYCGFDKDSLNWDTLVKVNDSKGKGVTASMCDVNEDGVIDMLDLLDLFIHYTK